MSLLCGMHFRYQSHSSLPCLVGTVLEASVNVGEYMCRGVTCTAAIRTIVGYAVW